MTIDQTAWLEKYKSRAVGARKEYEAGVKAPKADPTEAAIEMQDTMLAKLTEAIVNGDWANGLRAVGQAGWQKACIEKGAPRYGPGITAGLPKYQAFVRDFAPHLEAGMASVRGMPKTTIEESIEKAAAMIRHNAAYKFRG